MNKRFHGTLALLLSVSALSAVTVRQDYFPLAEGNRWAYTKESTPNDEFKAQMIFEVEETNDTAFIMSSLYIHPLANAVKLYDTLKTCDNGIVTGFSAAEGKGTGMIRHLYYEGNSFETPEAESPQKLFHISEFCLGNSEVLYKDVWAADVPRPTIEFMGTTDVMAQGIGRLGFQLDLSTKELPETGHFGFCLDSSTVAPKPKVTDAQSVMTGIISDSTFTVKELGDGSLELSFVLSDPLGDKGYVTSSYNEITNTLRIWLADTVRHWSADVEPRFTEGYVRPRGYYTNTLKVKNVDPTTALNVKIFYNFYDRQKYYSTADIIYYSVYHETINAPTPVAPAETNISAGTALALLGEELRISLATAESATLLIEDLRGRVLMKKSVMNGETVQLTASLSRGIYLARLKSTAGVATQKIRIR